MLSWELQEAAARVVLDVAGPGAGETLEAGEQPRAASFQEADAQPRKLVQDAVEDDAGETDHLAHGVAQGVDRRVGRQVVHEHPLVAAAVDADGASQPLRFPVDGPVTLGAQMGHVGAGGRQHAAAQAQLLHHSAQLFRRRLGVLQRDQPHGLETRALGHVGLVDSSCCRPAPARRPSPGSRSCRRPAPRWCRAPWRRCARPSGSPPNPPAPPRRKAPSGV